MSTPIYDVAFTNNDARPAYRSPAREYDEAARFATGLRNGLAAMLILAGIVLAAVWVVA